MTVTAYYTNVRNTTVDRMTVSQCFQHKELHQGWKQTSIHLLLIPHKSHETAKFFKIHKNQSRHKYKTEHTNIKHKFSKK